jgi:hypothetical protein
MDRLAPAGAEPTTLAAIAIHRFIRARGALRRMSDTVINALLEDKDTTDHSPREPAVANLGAN